jgi:hypothetical protein
LNSYVAAIVRQVEPEILGSITELRNACPSYDQVCRRGYQDRLKVDSLAELEEINALYRERDRRNAAGERWEIDHQTPLFKGGLHSVTNLKLVTYEEHRKKSGAERKKGA